MDQKLKDTILDNLTKAETIAIVVSKSGGIDGLASGLALYLSLIKLDKNVSIIAKSPTVGDAQNLYGVDRIGRTEGSQNPVIIIDNAVETVDKVTYFLDKTRLKVVVHPLPGTQQITKDQISIEYASTPANVIFTIGIDNLHDLRSEFTHEQEINPDAWIINISNLDPSQKFAQVDVVNTQASGISEVLAKMLQDLALPIDEDIAFNLYTGVRTNTDNFQPSMVSPISFEIASWLLKFGAGKSSIARHQHRPDQIKEVGLGKPAPFPTQPPVDSRPKFSPPTTIDTTGFFENVPGISEVETEPQTPEAPKSGDWLKPPKIYQGSKSFNGENKG